MNSLAKTMVAFATALVIGFGIVYSMPPSGPDIVDTRLQTQVFEPSVQLNNFCSATIITSGLVLTAKHCVLNDPGPEGFYITQPLYDNLLRKVGEKKYDLELVKVATDKDLALLRVKEGHFNLTAKFNFDTVLEYGEKVFTSSFPLAQPELHTDGHLGHQQLLNKPDTTGWPQNLINQLLPDWMYNNFYIMSTAPVKQGSSGSGLFVIDEAGDYVLIGVLSTIAGNVTTIANYVAPQDIKEFLVGEI